MLVVGAALLEDAHFGECARGVESDHVDVSVQSRNGGAFLQFALGQMSDCLIEMQFVDLWKQEKILFH